MRELLKGGANTDRAGVYVITALHQAPYYGCLDVCRLLLEWGAKLDFLDDWENTPLYVVAWWGNFQC
jgi:ankyrin repeat protein